MSIRPGAPRHLLSLASLSIVSLLGGCAMHEDERTYSQAYDQKLYAEAFEKAAPIAQDPGAADREKAMLVAGMSAQALGKPADARRYLTPLKTSTNNDVAGRATNTLGLLAAKQGDSKSAGALFRSGAQKLEGDDAALAVLHAGDAYDKAGQHELAKAQYARGLKLATNPALKRTLTERCTPKSFYVQTGAYTIRKNAEKLAGSMARTVVRKGHHSPVVVENRSGDRTLYAVQIGPYDTRDLASQALASLGSRGTIVQREN